MTAVLIPWVAGPIRVVIALLLLLVLLKWLNTKIKLSSGGEQNMSKPGNGRVAPNQTRSGQAHFNTYFVSFVIRLLFC